MERYFILMVVAMLVGATEKNKQVAHSRSSYQQETRTFATVQLENSMDHASAYSINTELETAWGVGDEARIYKSIVNNSTPKIAKNWRGRVNKATCSANPRILFNILRSLPMGESYFIQ